MRSRSHRFLDHWHRQSVTLPDGDVLTYTVMDEPAPPRLECPRTERRGSIWPGEALRLLAELDHPDAELPARLGATFGPGPFH